MKGDHMTEKSIDQVSWEMLHAYKFNTYPFTLVVITNATPDEFEEATEEFAKLAESGECMNIEDILQKNGFVAVTGKQTDVEVTL